MLFRIINQLNFFLIMKKRKFFRLLWAVFVAMMMLPIGAAAQSGRCLVVKTQDMEYQNWDYQFWFYSPTKFHEGDTWEVSMMVKADKVTEGMQKQGDGTDLDIDGNGGIMTQTHSNYAGNYIHYEGVGNVKFTTEWESYTAVGEFVAEQEDGDYIAFNLSDFNPANTYYFDNISFKINGVEQIVNGDFEDDDFSSFWVKCGYYNETVNVSLDNIDDLTPVVSIDLSNVNTELNQLKGTFVATYEDGSKKELPISYANTTLDPSITGVQDITVTYKGVSAQMTVNVINPCNPSGRHLVLKSADMRANPWDNQFWFEINIPFNEGDFWEVSMDVKADIEAEIETQTHKDVPGDYIHWEAIGTVPFHTEWTHYTNSGVVSSLQQDGRFVTFNLNTFEPANTYYIDNISLKIKGVEVVTNGDFDGDDLSSFYFRYDKMDDDLVTYEHVTEANLSELPVSISITTLPNKTEYYEGDYLNLEGGQVTATYPDGSTKTVSLDDVQISYFDNTKIGEQTIIVNWLGLETDFTVTVKEDTRAVKSLSPDDPEYVVGFPSNRGYLVSIYFENGDFTRKSIFDPALDVKGLDGYTVGVQDVTISYKGVTWSGQIEIYKPIAYLDFSNITMTACDIRPYGMITVVNQDGTSYEVDINKSTASVIVPFESGDGWYSWYVYDYKDYRDYDRTIGEHEIEISYRNTSGVLKYTIADDPTPYVVIDNGCLTFYYGKNKPAGAFDLMSEYSWMCTPAWSWWNYSVAVFDESFKNYKPRSSAFWFSGGWNLTEIKGLENINTENITDMSNMFYCCKKLDSLDLSSFNTGKVTNMSNMFSSCYNLHTIYVSNQWDVSSLANDEDMFTGCDRICGEKGTLYSFFDKGWGSAYAHIDGGDANPGYLSMKGNGKAKIVSIEISKMPQTEYVLGESLNREDGVLDVNFENRETQSIPFALNGIVVNDYDSTKIGIQTLKVDYLNASTSYDVNVINKDSAYVYFNEADSTMSIYFGEYKQGAYLIEPEKDKPLVATSAKNVIIDKSFLNYRPTSLKNWFAYFYNLEGIEGLEYINTEKVTNMAGMFSNCSNIQTLDLRNFNTANVTNMQEMFYGCNNLRTIYVSKKWDNTSVDNSLYMFALCSNLVGGEGTKCDGVYQNFDLQFTHIDGGSSNPGYFTKVEPIKYTLKSLPFKTEYLECDELSLDGGTFEITYNSGSYDIVDLAKANVTGFDGNKIGTQTVKVVYETLDTAFDVSVVAKSPVKIAIITLPTKTEYLEGDALNVTGGSFVVYYNNNTTDTLDLAQASVTGFVPLTVGVQTLKVAYLDTLTTTFDVTVVAKSPIEIAIITLPNVEYVEGDALNLGGGSFVVYYNNNTTDTLNLDVATITGYDAAKVGTQTLTVEYLGQKAQFDITVKMKNPFTQPALKDGFYQISNAEELLWFMFDVNSGDVNANAQLTQDIVINEDCLKRLAEMSKVSKAGTELTTWQPIGTLLNAFNGIFDGQGHTISGLYIDDKTQDNVGLFGVTASDAVIKNLGVTDSYIAGKENVGAICGSNEGVIVNCYTTATIEGEKSVSGIAGKVEEKAVVENSYYLVDEPVADDPSAKTAADFRNGEVAKLLSQGAVIDGETISGDDFSNVTVLPGVEDLKTPVSEIAPANNIDIWSFEKTIYVQNPGKDIRIADMSGRLVMTIKATTDRMEIPMQKAGIYIVKTGVKTQKVIIR